MKKFRFYIITMLLVMATTNFLPKVVLAEEKSKELKSINVSALTAIALDADTGAVLYEKNAHKIVPMASTTKIATALVALKYGDMDKKVQISNNSTNVSGSKVGYRKNEEISIRELLYGLMFKSGNDAAIAIAEGVAGSVDGFMELMNEYAMQIGLMDTNFQTPHGLDKEEHFSSAYDLAILTAKAKKDNVFSEIVSSKEISKEKMNFTRDYNNINKLLWQIPEANGVKTGYTGNAGKCLVSSVAYDNKDIIIVVLNCNERWSETKKIYEYVCKNYEYKKIISSEDIVSEFQVKEGNKKAEAYLKEDMILPIKKDSKWDVDISINNNIKAPLEKDEIIGKVTVKGEGGIIYQCPLYNKENVKSLPKYRIWLDNIFN
ncbi:D-alanyl-D-alanine carboxypeptidase family protein [Clostridium amazonitimonense]|uniref:D-alanyl-D-alanine carboxypeptidase family protein n=1 Tax=Clostridium amazonitimonense TaxID=1499689 RepID=UPI000509DED9|nr:D-alanyl-D-alanine carboxypeptidase family protein [Clostridium amazonitimonense]